MKKILMLMIAIAILIVVAYFVYEKTVNTNSENNKGEDDYSSSNGLEENTQKADYIISNNLNTISEETANMEVEEETNSMKKQISVTNNDIKIIFELNDSIASEELYNQLPLEVNVENFSDNEKTFYPEKLNVSNTPLADAKKGTLCYYAPWGDVVMFYKDYGKGSSLYELGECISGEDDIEKLSGTIKVEKVN